MMAQVNAGRVRFVGRGEYNNSTQYYVFDLVSYNGNSYYAKVDTIGHLPTDTTYWQLVAEKGNVGPTGPTGNGISSIEKTSTSGLVDTYTITFTNGNTTTFDVSNGNGIDRIEKTATVGNIDTYTIYFNDNSTSTFEVANGEVTKEELEEEVDRLSMIYNLFPTTSDEDTEMTLNGTAEVPFKKLNLKGNTSQFSTTGKNLFATTGNLASSISEANEMTKTGTGTECTLTKNSTGSSSPRIAFDSSFFEVNTTYYISFEVKGDWEKLEFGTWIGNQQVVIDTKTPTSTYQKVTCQFTYPSTKTSNDKVYFKNNDRNVLVGQTLTINNFMISKTNDYDYEPFTGNQPSPNPDYPQDIQVVSGNNSITIANNDNTQSQTYPINIGNIELCKIGTYQDYIYKENKKWYLHKEFNKVVLNGTETWRGGSAGTTSIDYRYLYTSVPKCDTNRVATIKCNYLKVEIVYGGLETSVSVVGVATADSDNLRCLIDKTLINNPTTDSEAKTNWATWLSTHNTIVYYPLATPTITEITDTTLIEQLNNLENAYSYDTQTNITQTNDDMPFILDVEAILSLKNIFNS